MVQGFGQVQSRYSSKRREYMVPVLHDVRAGFILVIALAMLVFICLARVDADGVEGPG